MDVLFGGADPGRRLEVAIVEYSVACTRVREVLEDDADRGGIDDRMVEREEHRVIRRCVFSNRHTPRWPGGEIERADRVASSPGLRLLCRRRRDGHAFDRRLAACNREDAVMAAAT